MPRTPAPIESPVTPAEALRFAAISEEVMASPKYRMGSHAAPADAPHIGTLREKRLHAAVKLYLCPDETCHERTVGDLLREDGAKPRRMVADILTDGHIMEVQTGGFFPLKPKVAWYLTHTPCRVTVVHPRLVSAYRPVNSFLSEKAIACKTPSKCPHSVSILVNKSSICSSF